MSERMQETELRYLEGSAALKERMQAISGREPNASQVAFASSCLLHGRMFWESADRASLETSPLLLYYGAAAFAKALVIAYTAKQPQDLKQAHGLSCSAPNGDRIGDFRTRASAEGLFQEFNDVAASLNRIAYLDDGGEQVHALPAAASDQLVDFDVSLDDCLSRTVGIEKTYKLCTGKEQNFLYLYPMQGHGQLGETFSIQVGVAGPVHTAEGLAAALASVRGRAPFLGRWRIREASTSYGMSTLTFINLEKPADELGELTAANNYGFILQAGAGSEPFDPFDGMPPLTGGWTSSVVSVAYAEPIASKSVSEYSVTLAGLLGLSSIVRYRPHIWTACVHRRRIGNHPVDDSLLPVIEAFLEAVKGSFPQFIAKALFAGKAP
jgi:YaaC-like Protein